MRLKPILLVFAVCLTATGASAQPGAVRWDRRIDEGAVDIARAVSAGGNRLLTAAVSTSAAGDLDIAVHMLDASTGRSVWSDRIDGSGRNDLALASAEQRGLAFVAGQIISAPGNRDWFVRAYDARTGETAWQDRLDLGTRDGLGALAAQGNRLFAAGVVGTCRGLGSGNCDAYVRAYDATTGAVLWSQRVAGDGNGFDVFSGIAVEGSRVVVTGGLQEADGRVSFAVRSYDAVTGALAWSDAHHDGPLSFAGSPSIAGGFVSVVGVSSAEPGPLGMLVRGYRLADGAALWSRRIPSAGEADLLVASSAAVTVVAGSVANSVEDRDFLVSAFTTSTGTPLWSHVMDASGEFDAAHALTLAGNRAVAAGREGDCSVFVVSECDFVVRTFDASSGAMLWETVDELGGEDVALAVAVGGDTVHAAGLTATDAGVDMVVRAQRLS